jgi:hypothetical protein
VKTHKVAVFGGGAGMSVAHELLARNDDRVHFDVDMF